MQHESDKIKGRTTDELIKGWWDDDKNSHVKGLWERVTDMEKWMRFAPHAAVVIIALEITVLARDYGVGAVSQFISLFFK